LEKQVEKRKSRGEEREREKRKKREKDREKDRERKSERERATARSDRKRRKIAQIRRRPYCGRAIMRAAVTFYFKRKNSAKNSG
jgi:hypothetical protein